jgi:hypothetical protein
MGERSLPEMGKHDFIVDWESGLGVTMVEIVSKLQTSQ